MGRVAQHAWADADDTAPWPQPYMAEHERMVGFLETLAMLMGCRRSLGGQFPDGCRPDVLQADTERGVLFIGDSKHTETPGCAATRARLASYMEWMAAHVRRGRIAVFAICFSRVSDAAGWGATLATLAHAAGMAAPAPRMQWFENDTVVVWITSSGLLKAMSASAIRGELLTRELW